MADRRPGLPVLGTERPVLVGGLSAAPAAHGVSAVASSEKSVPAARRSRLTLAGHGRTGLVRRPAQGRAEPALDAGALMAGPEKKPSDGPTFDITLHETI